jgi:hypothetical protein
MILKRKKEKWVGIALISIFGCKFYNNDNDWDRLSIEIAVALYELEIILYVATGIRRILSAL